jgi:MerR family mercuric resistance operon transcriptional regulator
MDERAQGLTIGGLATQAGVGIETVRFYQRRGLLGEPPRPQGGIRRYGAAEVARLKFVKAAQRLGFSLDEVGELLRLEDGTHCDTARELAEAKLRDVRLRLADLRRMERTLARLVQACGGAHGTVSCPMIAALQSS